MKNITLGQKIRELRKEKQITQKELANIIQVNKSAISFWELDINEPTASKIIKLAKTFNISTDELLGVNQEYETFEYTDGTHTIKHKKKSS